MPDFSRAATKARRLWPVLLIAAWGCSTASTTISWGDVSANEQGFRIYRTTDHGTQLIGEVGPGTTRFIDRHALRNPCYRVTAFNAAGESLATPMVCART